MVDRKGLGEWSWLQGGVALGLLSAFAFLSYKPLGVSTSYPRAVALALNTVIPAWVAENKYFQVVQPVVDWQLMLVLGIIAGGWLAARFTGPARAAAVAQGTGPGASPAGGLGSAGGGSGVQCPISAGSRRRSPASLFFGGFLVLFGARLAGGCTSGHVITGFSQLAVASFLFAATVFAVGIPMARYLSRREVA